MLYIAAGFLLVLAVPFLVFTADAILPATSVTWVILTTQCSQVLGLVSIL